MASRLHLASILSRSLTAGRVFLSALAKMQKTRLSILIVVGALLCACNGVWGSWIPSVKMAAPSNVDEAAARRKFSPRDGVPFNDAVATARTLRNHVVLPYAIATKTKVRSLLAGVSSDYVMCLRTPMTATRLRASPMRLRSSAARRRAVHAARHGDLAAWTASSEDRNRMSCTFPLRTVSMVSGRISAV